jgi:hypothetical protein
VPALLGRLRVRGCLCPECLQSIEDARPPRPNVWAFLKKNLKRSS